MLNRKQIMMTHWLDDYTKYLSEQYDISYSEVLRLAASLSFAKFACALYPDCKKHMTMSDDEAIQRLQSIIKEDNQEEQFPDIRQTEELPEQQNDKADVEIEIEPEVDALDSESDKKQPKDPAGDQIYLNLSRLPLTEKIKMVVSQYPLLAI